MIKAAFYTRNGHYIGFSVTGHAGFDEEGHDIVCASVSALTVNTVNSLEKFTSDRVITEYCDDGMVKCKLTGNVSPEVNSLLRASDSVCVIFTNSMKTSISEFLSGR